MKKSFTQLENETMEALARAPLSAREFKVMLAVIRVTNGYHLTENRVRLKDLIELTGLARNHLQATVKRLSLWQVVVVDEDGLIACHGPALWHLPDSPKSGLSAHSPKSGLSGRQAATAPTQSQVGTISDSPELGLSHIVPPPDTPPILIKKVQRKYKESTLNGEPREREVRGAEAGGKRGGNQGVKPRHADAVEALVAVERAAGVKLVDRVKLLYALRRTLVAYPEATPGDMADCVHRLSQDGFWGTKPLATLLLKLPDEFPLYWKLKSEGRVDQFHGRAQGRGGYAETRVSAAFTDPEDYRRQTNEIPGQP